MPREIGPVPAFEEEVLDTFRRAETACVAGAHLLLEELETLDPDLSERCGLLAARFEVYALCAPGCARMALAVSLDIAAPAPWPCRVHGLIPARGRPCAEARARATRHFALTNPVWEPADDDGKLQIPPARRTPRRRRVDRRA